MKIVLNCDYGGFDVPEEWLSHLGLKSRFDKIARTDLRLVKLVETEVTQRNDLRVVVVPDDVKWHIEEYDGVEWVAEDHRVWLGRELL